MRIELDSLEARVIGCMLEKQITTPDQYPLSLNALVAGCNQKSNRDPVMSLDEPTVQRTLDGLSRKHLVLERSGFGSRVPKYQQLFCNTEYGSLKFSAQELAIVCELLLRGPQTPGELRSRAARMAAFAEVSEVEAALENLLARAPPATGARAARVALHATLRRRAATAGPGAGCGRRGHAPVGGRGDAGAACGAAGG